MAGKLHVRHAFKHNKDKTLMVGAGVAAAAVVGVFVAVKATRGDGFGTTRARLLPSSTVNGSGGDINALTSLTLTGFGGNELITTSLTAPIQLETDVQFDATDEQGQTSLPISVKDWIEANITWGGPFDQITMKFEGQTSHKTATLVVNFTFPPLSGIPPKISAYAVARNADNPASANFTITIHNVNTESTAFRVGFVAQPGGTLFGYTDITVAADAFQTVTLLQAAPWAPDTWIIMAGFAQDADPFYDTLTSDVTYSAPFTIPA